MSPQKSLRSVLITGANGGLGKEAARQLALQPGIEKIYLGCRNETKAQAAKQELEIATGKSIFEIVLIDVSNIDSVRAAVESFVEPIDGLVMNAGGMGGKDPGAKTAVGVIQIVADGLLVRVKLQQFSRLIEAVLILGRFAHLLHLVVVDDAGLVAERVADIGQHRGDFII